METYNMTKLILDILLPIALIGCALAISFTVLNLKCACPKYIAVGNPYMEREITKINGMCSYSIPKNGPYVELSCSQYNEMKVLTDQENISKIMINTDESKPNYSSLGFWEI